MWSRRDGTAGGAHDLPVAMRSHGCLLDGAIRPVIVSAGGVGCPSLLGGTDISFWARGISW